MTDSNGRRAAARLRRLRLCKFTKGKPRLSAHCTDTDTNTLWQGGWAGLAGCRVGVGREGRVATHLRIRKTHAMGHACDAVAAGPGRACCVAALPAQTLRQPPTNQPGQQSGRSAADRPAGPMRNAYSTTRSTAASACASSLTMLSSSPGCI